MNKEQQVEEMNKRKPPKAGTTPSPKTINEERQKDEIILIVKQAFNANSGWADEDAYVIDSNDVYHTAKETAEALYNAGYRKTFTSELASETQKAYKEGYIKGIEETEAEIERLKADNEALTMWNNASAETIQKLSETNKRFASNMKSVLEIEKKNAVKEFAEKLKIKAIKLTTIESYHICEFVDELLKEYEK